MLDEVDGGLVTRYVVLDGNPSDGSELPASQAWSAGLAGALWPTTSVKSAVPWRFAGSPSSRLDQFAVITLAAHRSRPKPARIPGFAPETKLGRHVITSADSVYLGGGGR